MGIESHKGFFKTRDEVFDDIKATGFWPTTYKSNASQTVPIHWHHIDVHGYILSGHFSLLDGESSQQLDFEQGDKFVVPARTLHAECAIKEDVLMILALSEPGVFTDLLEQVSPELLV
ncbi:MAG: hypothetical protein ACI9ZT_000321 [Gammaproteobacteria bacterium]